MIIFKRPKDINYYLQKNKNAGRKIGFVPTMGALHPGHISLLKQSLKQDDITVCSIFVNPAQFNDIEDFKKYPITLEHDIDLLENNGCHVVFIPTVADIYPGETETSDDYNLGTLTSVLEGKYRPGHFAGVCRVMHRLLHVVPTKNLYLGQKDYQQCMVIKRLIEEKRIDTAINICPTLREPDGLAMSSRNQRLSIPEKEKATAISNALSFIKTTILPGDLKELKEAASKKLTDLDFRVDYIDIADADTLKTVDYWNGDTKLVALAAAYLGKVRLIDNLLLNSPGQQK